MLNLTPHAIVIRFANGDDLVISPTGKVARLTTEETTSIDFNSEIGPIPVISTKVTGVTEIPDPMTNIKFLVSSMVLDSLGSEYAGLAFAPDTGATAIRDDKGHIVGVTRLRTVAK